MTIAPRIAVAGASLIALAACTPADPVAVNSDGNEANLTIADVVANDGADTADTGAPAPVATTRSEPMSKTGAKNVPRRAPKSPPSRPEPLPSPTQPPAEVDPVRNVDITDPG